MRILPMTLAVHTPFALRLQPFSLANPAVKSYNLSAHEGTAETLLHGSTEDTGMLQLPDYRFIRGHEWDGEISLYFDGLADEGIHVWVGYLYDILREADQNRNKWTGFTRDCLLEERTMDPHEPFPSMEGVDEYLADWKQYADKPFELPEARGCYNLILDFLEAARDNGRKIKVMYYQTVNWKPVGDTGLPVLPDNRFYKPYEGETEIVLSLVGNMNESIHIWECYFDDVLDNPDLSGNGWTGFMRDWQQGERALAWNLKSNAIEDLDEYIADWKQLAGDVEDTRVQKNVMSLSSPLWNTPGVRAGLLSWNTGNHTADSRRHNESCFGHKRSNMRGHRLQAL